MGKALYRKYRSKSLDEIIGQEHITKTLANALKSGNISHAYLFTGPRGVGKTSVARILAHEINNLPYTDDSAHLDIIEIDAASNRRIDEIRDLREKVHITPTTAKYKVYIIDEVHMLTKEAFNALLKTLEEPPEHVIFILATTEAHKLPETIVSRTQRFSFKPIKKTQAIEHLRALSKTEGITVDDEALELMCEHANGSFRDSISLLDQASSITKNIKLSDVKSLLGIPPEETIDALLKNVAKGSVRAVVELLREAREQGFHAPQIAKQLAYRLRAELIDGSGILPKNQLVTLLKHLLEVPASNDPGQHLELVLLETALTMPSLDDNTASLPGKDIQKVIEVHPQSPISIVTPKDPARTINKEKTINKRATSFSLGLWPDILRTIKQQHSTLYSILRMAQPAFDGEQTLTLAFQFPFHMKRINEAKNHQALVETITKLSGYHLHVTCELDKSAKPYEINPEVAVQDPVTKSSNKEMLNITTISNIFGGGEVLD